MSNFDLEAYLELQSLLFSWGLFGSDQTWKRTSFHWSIPGAPHKPTLKSQLIVSTKFTYDATWPK